MEEERGSVSGDLVADKKRVMLILARRRWIAPYLNASTEERKLALEAEQLFVEAMIIDLRRVPEDILDRNPSPEKIMERLGWVQKIKEKWQKEPKEKLK